MYVFKYAHNKINDKHYQKKIKKKINDKSMTSILSKLKTKF